MLLRDFEHNLYRRVLDVLWRQWSSLGVAGSGSPSASQLVVDPEALLAATLSFGRRDPRLFDEVIDWLTLNGDLMNVARLHTLMKVHRFTRAERPLAAVSHCVGTRGRMRQRWTAASSRSVSTGGIQPEALFLDESGAPLPTPRNPDPVFMKFGLLREQISHRGLSQPFPGSGAPTLLLQLRALFGVSSRCELCCLLATHASLSGSEAAFLAGYTPRAVQEALSDMSRTAHVSGRPFGKQIKYSLAPDGALRRALPQGAFRFPSSAALFGALEAIAATVAQCIERDPSPDASAALLRREIEPASRMLARAGLPVALNVSLDAAAMRFLESLDRDVEGLIAEWVD